MKPEEKVLVAIFAKTEEFRAHTFDELVEQMRKGSWTPYKTVEEFMAAIDSRVQIYFGPGLRYHDAESFIDELLRIGVLEVYIVDASELDGGDEDGSA